MRVRVRVCGWGGGRELEVWGWSPHCWFEFVFGAFTVLLLVLLLLLLHAWVGVEGSIGLSADVVGELLALLKSHLLALLFARLPLVQHLAFWHGILGLAREHLGEAHPQTAIAVKNLATVHYRMVRACCTSLGVGACVARVE